MGQKLKNLLIVILLSLSAVAAGATQVIENAYLGRVEVKVSDNETNRLAIEGRRIMHVVAGVKGVISGQKDELLGAYYFTLNSESHQQPFTVFVSDENGVTYKLMLVPHPAAGEEIILRPPPEKRSSHLSHTPADDRAVSYKRRIKSLMLSMADETLKDSVEIIAIDKEVPLWTSGRLLLIAKYIDGDQVGEKYRLINVSTSEMLLVEQELYRPGVHAVAMEKRNLMQGDSTEIYIVRERKDDE